MPTPEIDFISSPSKPGVKFSLEPAQNGINSLVLLNKVDALSGLDDWVAQTAGALTKAQMKMHRVVTNGLFYIIYPTRGRASFLAHIEDLEKQDPDRLRNRLFNAYARFVPHAQRPSVKSQLFERPQRVDVAPLLADREVFLTYLRERFSEENVDVAVESEAHALLNDPPLMKKKIIEHLRFMWTKFLAAEWERVTPMLQACVDAFEQVDFSGMTPVEAVRFVTGEEAKDWQVKQLQESEQVIFVPSAHLGPYQSNFQSDRVVWLLFGARTPKGVRSSSPDLSRSELLTRLLALADDTRLRILRLIADEGELRSPEVMHRLDLSQSAASRHLQQLSATGYLRERRRDGAKVYSLNAERVDDTLNALSQFLGTR